MSHLTKGVLRSAKNYTKGYSDTQAKVRDATSNDPLPPSGQQLNEIAQMTMNQQDFIEVMEMLDKRLNDKGKNWRHVFKSLLVLDFCLFQGSENVGIYFRDNMYIIKTLREFQYVDEEGKDQGANVRQKAKDITNLLMNDSRLRDGRKDKGKMKDRMRDDSDRLGGGSLNGSSAGSQRKQGQGSAGQGHGEDEDAMRKAIEESKRSAALKQAEDRDLMQAIQRSEEEEAKRVKAVEDANASALFDDEQQQPAGNFTLVDPSQYTQGLQPQYTQIQPQFTAFNPYQQQADQEAMQAQYLQQQQEWQLMQQQQQLQQQQQQQQLLQQQQQAEEWMRQQQLLQLQQQQQQQQQQQLQPQPTGFGTKNPFAPSSSPIPPMPSLSPQPPSSIDRKPVEFNLQGTFSSSPSLSPTYTPPPPQPNSLSPTPAPQFRPPKRADDDHAELANLFANRDDGQDTFGNIGALRYGHTDAGRVVVQKTGVSNNPFGQQQPQQLQQVSNERPFFDI